MSPRDRSPVRTSSPRHPSGKDPWNQWTTYTLTLLQLEQTTDSSGRRGTTPPTEPGLIDFKTIVLACDQLVGMHQYVHFGRYDNDLYLKADNRYFGR